MKIEQLLVQHFYNTREVCLQGIGKLTLAADFVLPTETDKDVVMPENAISFEYDSRMQEDDALIQFIVQQTHKIKPLASADLDSYLTLGKQFLNIGKPFKIDGLGTLEKNQQGSYEFKQGIFANSRMEAASSELREKRDDDDISFATQRVQQGGNGKKTLMVIAILLVLSLAGWGLWYFFTKSATPSTVEIIAPVTQPDSMPHTDSSTLKPVTDTLLTKQPVPMNKDSFTFRIVFGEKLDKANALSKMKAMTDRGHKVIMYTSDSVYYKLAEPFKIPISDTAKIKDSLNRFYYHGKAYVEMN